MNNESKVVTVIHFSYLTIFFSPMGKVLTYVALVSWENFLWFHFKHYFLCTVCNL